MASKRNRPCDACRRRKSKCVTEDGSSICVLCKFHGQACNYLEAPQPRKRLANPAFPSDGQSPTKRHRPIHTKAGTGVEEYDALPGPSLLKRTLGLQNRHHSDFVGLNAIPDVYGPQPAQESEGQRSDSSRAASDYIRFVDADQAFRILPDSETTGYDQERFTIDEIEATACGHGPKLVELFFRTVHPSFPILHKDVFLEKYARSYREFSPPLLAAVYLLASCYWGYSDSLATERPIDTSALQIFAFDSLQNTMRRPKLSTIQAGLLLSQYQKAFMGPAPNDQRDRLTVQLVNISHGLGLHLDCTFWDIPEWEVGLRRRIGWALYMQDKWTSLLEGRPSLISFEDWCVEDLSEVDFPEVLEDEQEGSSEVERGRLVFTHMAHLTVILSEILRSIFSTRARKSLETAPDRLAALLECMKPLQIKLRDWSTTLPDSLTMETAASMKLSSVGYLRLAYLTVEVCVHRNLLRTLAASEAVDPTLSQVCRTAAKERFANANDFVQRLQAQHLAAFWYFPSAKCCGLIHSFGQMLELTAFDDDEMADYARKLKEFKWALKVNSEAGANFMRQALVFINASVRIVGQAQEIFHRDSVSTTTSPQSAGYSLTNANVSPNQETQWTQPVALDGAYQSTDLYTDAFGLDDATFANAHDMLAQFPTDLDHSWDAGVS